MARSRKGWKCPPPQPATGGCPNTSHICPAAHSPGPLQLRPQSHHPQPPASSPAVPDHPLPWARPHLSQASISMYRSCTTQPPAASGSTLMHRPTRGAPHSTSVLLHSPQQGRADRAPSTQESPGLAWCPQHYQRIPIHQGAHCKGDAVTRK